MEKISLQDLADGLAARKGISRKDAETFVRNVFDIIQEYLLSEEVVKVKGLGTFKLIVVDSRESINVNTGERITISSHGKVSFTPDKTLSDRINKPFNDFETVIINENTKTEDMERLDGPIGAEPAMTEGQEATPEAEKEVATEAVQAEPDPVPSQEPEPAETPEPETVETKAPVPVEEVEPVEEPTSGEELAPIEEPTPEPAGNKIAPVAEPVPADEPALPKESEPVAVEEEPAESEPVPAEEPAVGEEPEKAPAAPVFDNGEKRKRRKRARRNLLLFCLLLIAMLLLWWWLSKKSETRETIDEKKPALVEKKDSTKIEKTDTTTTKPVDSASGKPTKPIEELVAENPQIENGEWWIVGTKATHVLDKGEDLSKLALKYYGDKRLISYIIRYNHYTAARASNLFVGAEVKIPELVKRE